MQPPPLPRRELWWLAVVPLLSYLLHAQEMRENYPFSHYPMYSQPSSRPLSFQFLADGSGNPLPVSWHTGVTPSQVGKMHGTRKKMHDDDAAAAAVDVLAFLRAQNAKRKGRELPARIQLIETSIGFDHGEFTESNRVLAENHAP